MNTANLQLEGPYVVISAALREKGVFEEAEIDRLLAEAESALVVDPCGP